MATPQRVLATSAIIALGIGSINSIAKYKRPPSARFVLGTGAAFFALSVLAEAEPDLAKAFGVAIASTVVLGQGDGLFSYINKYGEANTQAGAKDPKSDRVRERQDDPQHALSYPVPDERPTALFNLPARPGLIP